MSKEFDVLVIGAGPGGYVAAIRAAQLGLDVACCEGHPYDDPQGEARLGGTCLNVGCIPSKALLASSEAFESVNGHLADHGITVTGARLDLAKMLKRKADIVGRMTKGIEFLFRKNKVTLLKGYGRFVGKSDAGYQVEIAGAPVVTARHVIIATGSKARHLPGAPVDQRAIVDNEGALKFTEVPKRLGVIGAGAIGLELGSVWRRLGADVTLLEALPDFLGAADEAVAKEAGKLLTRQGLKIQTGVQVGEIQSSAQGVTVRYTDAAGAARTLECDRLIVSVGRVPNTDNLGLDAIGLATDARGFIEVDDRCAAPLPNLWAIGDVVRGPMLAHKAEEEGVAVAERIVGQKPHIDYRCIPSVIYTAPEIAWVGQTEQQLRAQGRAIRAGQFPFSANGRALSAGAAEGFAKVIADAATDEILGVHIVSAHASELIAEAVAAMEFKASAEDIGRICHAHPSMSEALREAALAVDKRSLNM